jgi:tRNA pseudouridine55 synthase
MNGWLILDKPSGISSTQATNQVRRILGVQKAGHVGTLDPFATGVLPIALGEATKAIPYVTTDLKQYRFQVAWGEERITDDCDGAVIKRSDHRPTKEGISAILPNFIGRINQQPPIFSALKIDGRRAYELARSGDAQVLKQLQSDIIQKTRPVDVHTLTLESVDSIDFATFVMTCGPGTYVRSIARDMAHALGTVAYVASLRRLQVGKFYDNDAIFLENLRELGHKSKLHHAFLPLGAVLDDIPAVPITIDEATMIRQGQRVPAQIKQGNLTAVVLQVANQVVAIAKECDGYFYPKRVFK